MQQNRKSRNRLAQIWPIGFCTDTKAIQWRQYFSTNDVGTVGHPHAKNKNEPQSQPHTCTQSFYPQDQDLDLFISDRWNNGSFHFILYTFQCCSNFQLQICSPLIIKKRVLKKKIVKFSFINFQSRLTSYLGPHIRVCILFCWYSQEERCCPAIQWLHGKRSFQPALQ